MKLYLLLACMVTYTTLGNAAEQLKTHESTVNNKHLVETKITEYESLMKEVEHSRSPAKDSIENFYKKYLEDLKILHKHVNDHNINIPQELHRIYLKNNPGVASYRY
jgi:hypothetical protein